MRISDQLGRGRPTVSFEFFPPKTEVGRAALIEVIDHLSPIGPDFVSVTYGAGGSTRALSFETCRQVKEHTAGHVMAHLTCVGHTHDEIAAIGDKLWDAGIVNIMALRGDRPKGVEPGSEVGDFVHAKDLMSSLVSRHDFCLGGACFPEGHAETPDIRVGIEHLKQKIDSGCKFLVTQMFFNNGSYFRFIEELQRANVEIPVIPGIMPITGFSQLDKFENQFGVQLPLELKQQVSASEQDEHSIEQIGVDWAAGQCRSLLAGGAPGIHFYTLNRSPSTVKVCDLLGLVGSEK